MPQPHPTQLPASQTIYLLTAVADGETTILGAASTRQRALTWLATPDGRALRGRYGDIDDHLDDTPEFLDRFIIPLRLDQLPDGLPPGGLDDAREWLTDQDPS